MISMWFRYLFAEEFVKMTGRDSCLVRIGKNRVAFDAEYYVTGYPEVEVLIPKAPYWCKPKSEPISDIEISHIKKIIPGQLARNDGIKSVKVTIAEVDAGCLSLERLPASPHRIRSS